MKILYLCSKDAFETKMSRVRFHGMQAIGKLCDLTWSGIGWENYNNDLTVQENINNIYSGQEKPDIVIAFKPLEMKNFSEVECLRGIRYNEMYDVPWTLKEIGESKSNIIICHHYNDMMEYVGRFKGFNEWPLKFISAPHCAEKTVFKDYNMPKTTDILLVGSIGYRSILGDHYPLRTRMYHLLSKFPKQYRCGYYPHPGGIHRDAHTSKYAIEFARGINSAKICVTDSGAPNSRFGKYVEVPMCGTALAADIPGEQQEQFKEFLIEINMSMTDKEITEKLCYYLDNNKEREELVQKGLDYTSNYTQEDYAHRLIKELEKVV